MEWYKVYRSLAVLLSSHYNKHGDNAGRELYKICLDYPDFTEIHPWVIKFSKVFNVRSIDPIHVFSSFNDSKHGDNIRRENKIDIFFRILSGEHYDNIDFTGCPSPFSIKIMAARDEKAQSAIWAAFQEIFLQVKQNKCLERIKRLVEISMNY